MKIKKEGGKNERKARKAISCAKASEYNNLGIGRLIYQLPIPLCKMFIKEIFDGKSPDDFDEETLSTINKFFEKCQRSAKTRLQ